jgi:hypothetical protein
LVLTCVNFEPMSARDFKRVITQFRGRETLNKRIVVGGSNSTKLEVASEKGQVQLRLAAADQPLTASRSIPFDENLL